ncbi:hypothetical protein EXIGLDRAFT_724053 [Exidia glandulosa HHB12029]|uniref:Uncharacterized protein n=1 Tax=Exidia glandulosa HHB12029 TaxID=1314781 RepID=A0A165EKR0_EXIGL|nr:hypothetical protein EXIGLDRAFT_724053 [Exidia glandulosa HHB12029]
MYDTTSTFAAVRRHNFSRRFDQPHTYTYPSSAVARAPRTDRASRQRLFPSVPLTTTSAFVSTLAIVRVFVIPPLRSFLPLSAEAQAAKFRSTSFLADPPPAFV